MSRIRFTNGPIRIFIFTLAWKTINLTEIFNLILRTTSQYFNEILDRCCTLIYGLKH